MTFRGRSGISFKGGGGSILGLQEKRGGSRRGGANFGPNVKRPISWAKKGGLDPDALPPGSAHDLKTFRSVGGKSLLLLYGIH